MPNTVLKCGKATMEALFRNALHFTTFLFYLVKINTQGIIPSKSDSFFVLSGKI